MALPLVPRAIASLPWMVLLVLGSVVGFSAIVLYSAAGASVMPWALPQAVRFGVFLVMTIVVSRLSLETMKRGIFLAYGAVMLLLIGVEVLGFVGGGARRWINLGFMSLQPSELMKPIVVMAVAYFYSMIPAREMKKWGAIWPAVLILGIPFFFILIQPDLGTATLTALGGVTVMFLAGVSLWLFIGGLVFLGTAGPIALSFLHDYQRERVLIFLNPESDPLGSGYHISQSKIAIGSGGLFGKGFLNGTQSHLDYLPEGHTDFIFATMAEEWGLMGGLFLLVAFGLLLRWGMAVSIRCTDRFSRLTAAGLTTIIFLHVAVNLMMVMGLAPVVGIPLPLFSYGGSAMMTVMLCVGIIMAIDRGNRRAGRP
jgi:rod shape determining protein RodA